MTKRERFLAGEVFSFLQKPHFYRFCPVKKVLCRNVNNSMIEFEQYTNIVILGWDDFDAFVKCNLINDSNTLSHHWLYDDLHFGWGKGLTGKIKDS